MDLPYNWVAMHMLPITNFVPIWNLPINLFGQQIPTFRLYDRILELSGKLKIRNKKMQPSISALGTHEICPAVHKSKLIKCEILTWERN